MINNIDLGGILNLATEDTLNIRSAESDIPKLAYISLQVAIEETRVLASSIFCVYNGNILDLHLHFQLSILSQNNIKLLETVSILSLFSL